MPNQFLVVMNIPVLENGFPVVGATATYEQTGSTLAGSTVLAPIFLDPELTIPAPNPTTAGSDGVLPQVWFSGQYPVDVIIRTPPVPPSTDPNDGRILSRTNEAPLISAGGSAAADISVIPASGNAGTDVQEALDILASFKSQVGLPGDRGKLLFQSTQIGGAVGLLGLTPAISSALTITNGGQQVFAHGKAGTPDEVKFELTCTAADVGYEVGDTIQVSPGASGNVGFSAIKDETNITVRFGLGGPHATVGGVTGGAASLTAANWTMTIRAWYYTPITGLGSGPAAP